MPLISRLMPVPHSNDLLVDENKTNTILHPSKKTILCLLGHFFNRHFPGQLAYVGTKMSLCWILLELGTMEVVVTTEAIRCAKVQSKCHHQQTNTQLFTGQMTFPC